MSPEQMLTEAAERGTEILLTAWNTLGAADKRALKSKLDETFKPRAAAVDKGAAK